MLPIVPRLILSWAQAERSVGVSLTGRRLKAGKEVAGWTIAPTFGTFSNHQAISDRVQDDLRTILNAELFQDASAIGADRLCAE